MFAEIIHKKRIFTISSINLAKLSSNPNQNLPPSQDIPHQRFACKTENSSNTHKKSWEEKTFLDSHRLGKKSKSKYHFHFQSMKKKDSRWGETEKKNNWKIQFSIITARGAVSCVERNIYAGYNNNETHVFTQGNSKSAPYETETTSHEERKKKCDPQAEITILWKALWSFRIFPPL